MNYHNDNSPDDEYRGPGRITREYTVWCGACATWDYVEGETKREAAHSATRKGYRQTKGLWLCPDCLGIAEKQLTAGVECDTL